MTLTAVLRWIAALLVMQLIFLCVIMVNTAPDPKRPAASCDQRPWRTTT